MIADSEYFIWSGMAHTPSTRPFLHDSLYQVPYGFRPALKKAYSAIFENDGERVANPYMREMVEMCSGLQSSLTPASIAYAAANHAMECQRIGKTTSLEAAILYAEKQGVKPAEDLPRLSCPQWWNRSMVTAIERRMERAAVRMGVVSRQSQLYVSDEILDRITSRKRRSALVMSQMVAVSDTGEELSMSSILQKSIANPAVRRAELMVRLAGFEQYAISKGHTSKFFTVTCPSKFHATKSNGKPNEKYQSSVIVRGEELENSPKVAQKYLTNVWSKVRARHADAKHIPCYGFRVAEPHHDGCPHWHIILFGEQPSLEAFDDILGRYACAEDADELKRTGRDASYKVEEIDYKKGSAVGYVSKYISKNIDGFGVGDDYESEFASGAKAVTTADRVRAWASVWGIRQFQQIGGAPVGVWRELRRIADPIAGSDKMELERVAADLSDWYGYNVQQGGAECKRKDMAVATYSEEFDPDTGEANINKYDELVKKVKGLEERGFFVLKTRTKTWTIGFKSSLSPELLTSEAGQPWTCVNNCNDDVIKGSMKNE